MRKLAHFSGVHHATISRIAAVGDPLYSTAAAIASCLGWPDDPIPHGMALLTDDASIGNTVNSGNLATQQA
jgi:hypothetical protein